MLGDPGSWSVSRGMVSVRGGQFSVVSLFFFHYLHISVLFAISILSLPPTLTSRSGLCRGAKSDSVFGGMKMGGGEGATQIGV